MVKKILLGLLLLFIVGSVFANIVPEEYNQDGETYYKYNVIYNKGWNIIPSDLSNYFSFVGAFGVNNINSTDNTTFHNNAIRYEFNPITKEFFGINPEEGLYLGSATSLYEYGSLIDELDESYRQDIQLMGSWYYFDQDREFTWLVPKDIYTSIPFRERFPMLFSGWNLIVIPLGVSENFFSDCEIKSMYMWDSQNKMWLDVFEELSLEDLYYEVANDYDLAGQGFAINVVDNCQLESEDISEESLPSLPSMPE